MQITKKELKKRRGQARKRLSRKPPRMEQPIFFASPTNIYQFDGKGRIRIVEK